MVEQALAHQAERAEPHRLGVGLAADQFPHNRAQVLRLRADALDHDGVQRAGGINHFAGDELAVPRVAAVVEDAQEKRPHKRPQPRWGRRAGLHPHIEGELLKRARLIVSQHLAIERILVAEVVVDGGDIGAGVAADVADTRPLEATFGEAREHPGDSVIEDRRARLLEHRHRRERAGGAGPIGG